MHDVAAATDAHDQAPAADLELTIVEAEPVYTARTVERLVRERLAELHGQKVFTQEELTRVVRDRLAKQERKHERAMRDLATEIARLTAAALAARQQGDKT